MLCFNVCLTCIDLNGGGLIISEVASGASLSLLSILYDFLKGSVSRDNVVGILTTLQAGRCGVRNPAEALFYSLGTVGSFLRREAKHSTPSIVWLSMSAVVLSF